MFEVPKSKAGEADNRFEFKIAGKKYSVPKMAYVTGEVVELLIEADLRGGIHDIAAQYALFGPKGTPVGDAVRTLDREQLEALTAAYQEASGVTTGESAASTDS